MHPDDEMPVQLPINCEVGNIVLYVLKEGFNAGYVRPAIALRVYHDQEGEPVDLHIFLRPSDFTHDSLVSFEEKVYYDPLDKERGTWHRKDD